MSKVGNFNATEDLFGNAAEYNDINKNLEPTMLDIQMLEEFPNHPFKVVDDNQMEMLSNSIQEYGIKEPLWVMKKEMSDNYYVIAGHRRKYAAEKVGLTQVPVNVLDIDMETATVLMVDSNIQREKISIAEKAKAYRLKHDAIHKQEQSQDELNDLIESDDCDRTVRRYIRLTYLTEELLQLVDEEKLSIRAGVCFSYFSQEEQELLFDYFESTQNYPTFDQSKEINELHMSNRLSFMELEKLLVKEKAAPKVNVTIKEENLYKYFPIHTPKEEMESLIMELLANYFGKKEG